MYCEKAKELLKKVKRSNWLPEYHEDGVRNVVTEICQLHASIEQTVEAQQETGNLEDNAAINASVIVHHHCILRNKRCILAYLNFRTERVKKLWWDTGSSIPAELKEKLSPKEINFFNKYSKLLGDYAQSLDLDLAQDPSPPKDLYILVRALRDCGVVDTEKGPVSLLPGHTHFVKRTDAELLIRLGNVIEIEDQKGL
eukprot:147532_1